MSGSGLAGIRLGIDRLQPQCGHEPPYPFSADMNTVATLQLDEYASLPVKRILGVDGVDRIQFGFQAGCCRLIHDGLVIVAAAGQADQFGLLGYAESCVVRIDERDEIAGAYAIGGHRPIR